MADCCGTYVLAFIILVVIMGVMLLKDRAQLNADMAENKSGSSDYVMKRNENSDVIGGTNLDRFFVECVLARCNDFTEEKNLAKSKLLAEKYNLPFSDGIEALYLEAMHAHKRISDNLYNEKLDNKRDEEQDEYVKLTRYAEYYGRDKRKAMLTDRMNELLARAKSLNQGAEMLIRSGQQKESDWAVLGGIANGLAGAGAGVATALDVQAKNAQIRAQNEDNMRAAMPGYMTITGSASKNRINADIIQKQIEALDEKLISETPASEVIKLIDIVNPTVEISETGAYKVTATVKTKNKLTIFGDVPAIVDGTILAHLFDGKHEIGTAKMVLPVEGISESVKAVIVGVGLSGGNPNKKYNVVFTEYKLWLMEE